MADFVHQFLEPFVDKDDWQYSVRVYASKPDHMFHAWIEFYPLDRGPALRTGVETEQATRHQLAYWATGLSGIYLEGAFARAKPIEDQPATQP